MSNFDLRKFDELGIYPRRWAIRAAEGSDEWLRPHIEALLVEFIALVKRAAEKGLGISVAVL
jgi:hypothetical protein